MMWCSFLNQRGASSRIRERRCQLNGGRARLIRLSEQTSPQASRSASQTLRTRWGLRESSGLVTHKTIASKLRPTVCTHHHLQESSFNTSENGELTTSQSCLLGLLRVIECSSVLAKDKGLCGCQKLIT